MKNTTIRNWGALPGTRRDCRQGRKHRLAKSSLLALLACRVVAPATLKPQPRIMILQNLTIPMGGVWLADANGGHWWQTDSVWASAGRPASANPWQLTNCERPDGRLCPPLGQFSQEQRAHGRSYVFVPDASTKSQQVARFI